MSAPKNKAKLQKMARKRRRKEAATARREWNRTEPSPNNAIGFSGVPFGTGFGVKMSEVLEDFAEPYDSEASDLDSYRKLLALAVVAWNAALCEEPKRGQMVDDVLLRGLARADEADRLFAKHLVEDMIERKERYFAHIRRPIIGFEVFDTGDGWHLNVASLVV